jgi:hypothetical protein
MIEFFYQLFFWLSWSSIIGQLATLGISTETKVLTRSKITLIVKKVLVHKAEPK